jgi:Gluconate 2-dehydrogenase subunit 3
MTRRVFLILLLGLCLLFVVTAGLGHRYRRTIYRKYLRLRLDDSADEGTLSPEQFQVIHAVFAVIAPTPAPSQAELLDFVNWRTSSMEGCYPEYRAAVELLESHARRRFGANFTTLSLESRDQLLRDILPRHTLLPLQESLPIQEAEPPGFMRKVRTAFETLAYRAEARFKYFVLWDLLVFYWSSSAGWSAVGYHSYPGVPDHPRGYTVPPGTDPAVGR